MSRYYLSILLFFVFVFEGTIFQYVTHSAEGPYIVVGRFVLVTLVLLGIYLGRSSSMFYALIFGLLYDVIYTNMLGVYLFGFGLTCYLFSLAFKRVQDSVVIPLMLVASAVIFLEFYQFGLFKLLDVTQISLGEFLEVRLWATVVANLCFAILLYYPLKKLIAYIVAQSKLRER